MNDLDISASFANLSPLLSILLLKGRYPMPRSFVVWMIVLGLLVPGFTTPQSATRMPVGPGESVCWDSSPQKTAHPILSWCKAHPWTVGLGTGLLVVGGIVASGVIASKDSGTGAGSVRTGGY